MARWGKPLAVHTDNGSEYRGSFERLCKASGVVHRRITAGNSKANGMAEWSIRSLKETLRRGLTAQAASFWSSHLPAALTALRHTPARAHSLAPFAMVTGRAARQPSLVPPPRWELPDDPSKQQHLQYYDSL